MSVKTFEMYTCACKGCQLYSPICAAAASDFGANIFSILAASSAVGTNITFSGSIAKFLWMFEKKTYSCMKIWMICDLFDGWQSNIVIIRVLAEILEKYMYTCTVNVERDKPPLAHWLPKFWRGPTLWIFCVLLVHLWHYGNHHLKPWYYRHA